MDTEQAARQLAELGNSHRLRAFRLLVKAGEEGLAVGEIQEHLDIPGSTLSHHISRLVWAGLVEQSREGRTLRCRANFPAMHALIGFLADECCTGVTATATCGVAAAKTAAS
ncbi:MAG: transcriptional regulator [Rhodospirillales bacterium CG15_BIG_FIL_POST_REV_8_21_14_020_66_15]|nr:MAG: transcriptional regulator [Rhodospirillales bacterium CG15_BIG_FIL_POST_REV_8_21_14_020_66_15]